jgi:hypothetical protein
MKAMSFLEIRLELSQLYILQIMKFKQISAFGLFQVGKMKKESWLNPSQLIDPIKHKNKGNTPTSIWLNQ